MNNSDDGKINEMQFDKGWWEFILSDEPVSYNKKESEPVLFSDEDENQWDFIEETFQNDIIIQVSIYGVNKGGLLASSDRAKGFIPISHILFEETPHSPQHMDEMLQSKIGKMTNVKIVECNQLKNKVVFSERAAQTENGKRRELIARINPGTVIEGKVTNITDFGVFVDLGGVEGLVHISELSWGRVHSPSNYAKINQMISVQILSVDSHDMHVALSIKRLTPNPWFEVERKYKPGDVVCARIVKILPYGAFACLEEGIEGLIHISTIKMNDKIKDLNEILRRDQFVDVEILQIDAKKHRLGLALVNPE